MDRERLYRELADCIGLSTLHSGSCYVPDGFFDRDRKLIRDAQFGTVGSGNHFVEFAVCTEITDRTRAWQV